MHLQVRENIRILMRHAANDSMSARLELRALLAEYSKSMRKQRLVYYDERTFAAAHPDTHVSIITDGASSRYVVEYDASATSLLCNFDIFFLFRRDLKGIGNNYGYDSGMDNFDIKFVATKFHGQGENQLIVVHIVAGGLVSDNANLMCQLLANSLGHFMDMRTAPGGERALPPNVRLQV
jgi:hypothetical protein